MAYCVRVGNFLPSRVYDRVYHLFDGALTNSSVLNMLPDTNLNGDLSEEKVKWLFRGMLLN